LESDNICSVTGKTFFKKGSIFKKRSILQISIFQKRRSDVMNRKRIGRAGAVAAAALLLIGAVYAYLTHHSSVTNEFTGGNNEIEIVEDFNPPKGLDWGANEYKKSVKITNNGNVPCYIRVYIGFSDGEVEERSGLRTANGGTYYSADVNGLDADISVLNPTTGAVENTIHKEAYAANLPDDWAYLPEVTSTNEDTIDSAMGGWYYYKEPVAAGESTSALFDQVLTYFESVDKVKAYQIIVYSESVQIRDHEGNEVSAADTTDGEVWKAVWKEFLTRSGRDA
jgi:alternate signal-mediated exported protein